MPLFARTPDRCFKTFREHVAALVAATLPTPHPVVVRVAEGEDPPRATLEFAGRPVALATNVGVVFLDLVQLLGAEREAKHKYRLRTLKYWYRLQETATGDPLIRWEYEPASHPHCRHHVHLRSVTLQVAGTEMNLDDLHLPTGWVTIEEMIRFLITDMEVRPPCGEKWEERLLEGERRFYEEFTGKRYKPS